MKKIMMISAVLILLGLSACSNDEPKEPVAKERLILIYAIAANNGLAGNLHYDTSEILEVAPKLNLKNNKLLMYSVGNNNECKLQELTYNSKKGVYEFATIKNYTDVPLSTEKDRIEEVLGYVDDNFDYERKGLILWSHGTGWLPFFGATSPETDKRRTFGQEKYEGVRYECNITTLAEAIPEDVFDFIWFDCCYMADIETMYQLREKASFIVGSVLEIPGDGMPYDLTMPYLLRKDVNLQAAASEFFYFYDDQWIGTSISIINTEGLERLAYDSSMIFATGTPPKNFSGIQDYSDLTGRHFYDMQQLLDAYTGVDIDLKAELAETMKAVVPFKLTSDHDWYRHPINVEKFSGLSMHHFIDNGSLDNEFYKGLEWYKATR